MRFEHRNQHGPESVARLENMLRQPNPDAKQFLYLADELVAHGHPDAMAAIGVLRSGSSHSGIHAHCDTLEAAWKSIRRHYTYEDRSEKFLDKFYARNGLTLINGKSSSKKLLVIFTTMYNNFWASSASLAWILKTTGCKILFLKDATRCNYHQGVAGFAADISGIAAAIATVAEQLGTDKIYVSGFSSGGYAALLTSLLLPSCHGYLGFSHLIDVSANSALPQSVTMPDALRARLKPEWFLDLRLKLEAADPAVPRSLIYGALAPRDAVHAEHLAGAEAIRLIRLPKARHNTPCTMLAEGQLGPAFNHLTSG